MTLYGPLAAARKADFPLDPVTHILESVISSIVCQECMYLDIPTFFHRTGFILCFRKASNFRLELLSNFLVYPIFKST